MNTRSPLNLALAIAALIGRRPRLDSEFPKRIDDPRIRDRWTGKFNKTQECARRLRQGTRLEMRRWPEDF